MNINELLIIPKNENEQMMSSINYVIEKYTKMASENPVQAVMGVVGLILFILFLLG